MITDFGYSDDERSPAHKHTLQDAQYRCRFEFIESLDFPGSQKIADLARRALPPNLQAPVDQQALPPQIQQQMQQLTQQNQQLQQALQQKQVEQDAMLRKAAHTDF